MQSGFASSPPIAEPVWCRFRKSAISAALVTKPTMIALGIGVAGACCAGAAIASRGVSRIALAWTAASCAVATVVYLTNRPEWLGKRDGRLTPRALLILPYLVAFRIAVALIRWWRGPDSPSLVSPGLWVGGAVDARTFPAGISQVVDLVAEYPAPAWVRAMPGYRNLPILDGAEPPSREAFLDVIRDLRDVPGSILVHCDSGRGRAPTMAAALLIARGLARDVDSALALVRAGRPVSSPSRVDVAFLCTVLPSLRVLQEHAGSVPASDQMGRRNSRGRI